MYLWYTIIYNIYDLIRTLELEPNNRELEMVTIKFLQYCTITINFFISEFIFVSHLQLYSVLRFPNSLTFLTTCAWDFVRVCVSVCVCVCVYIYIIYIYIYIYTYTHSHTQTHTDLAVAMICFLCTCAFIDILNLLTGKNV